MAILIAFSDVEKMLKKCAQGHEIVQTTHGRAIKYNGRHFRGFPKYDEVYAQYVKKLVLQLQINEDCAANYVGEAFPAKKKQAPS